MNLRNTGIGMLVSWFILSRFMGDSFVSWIFGGIGALLFVISIIEEYEEKARKDKGAP